MEDFYDLFVYELRNIYAVEEHMVEACPRIVAGVHSKKLKEALDLHGKETKIQLGRLEKISLELNEKLKGQTCPAMTACIKEIDRILHHDYDPDVKDAALVANLQKIEHYEIACYGTLKAYAKHFKMEKVLALLEESSQEEGKSNKALISLAEGSLFSSGINRRAIRKSA
jgi:ferritin-like metal-binding protein YciE